MNKLILAVGIASLSLAGAPAFAQQCDGSLLPNSNWSFQTSTTTEVVSGLYYNGGNNSNLFVDVATVTSCDAYNKGGNLNTDHSYTIGGGTTERVLICNQINGLTPEGAALGFTDLDCL